ncbi:tetratricopeptide repeat protein [Sorangium sp. So ce1014]|uniref:tetratricopeptide repeat protein n=1 Tax=Sorangium sp. So ce1014 TaxID=3133326 RepID=UPI003F5FC97E
MDDRLKQLLVLGREHYERREYDLAEHALRQILEKTDRFADVFNMLGVILHERGDFLAAEAHFERAVQLNEHYTEALLNLAVTYNDLGKYEAARQVYSRIRRGEGDGGVLDPFARGKIANMHADLAQAYADAGCAQEAIAELKRAVALCPTFVDLQLRLGTMYRDAGNLPLAREHYAAACDANPKYAPARVLLGVALHSLGASEHAIAEWHQALAIEPDNKTARMYLRMVEAQRSGSTGDAVPRDSSPTIARGGSWDALDEATPTEVSDLLSTMTADAAEETDHPAPESKP